MITEYLKNYKITKKEFATYIGYSQQGLAKALKAKNKSPLLFAALQKLLLEKKGINLDKILKSLEKH